MGVHFQSPKGQKGNPVLDGEPQFFGFNWDFCSVQANNLRGDFEHGFEGFLNQCRNGAEQLFCR